MFDTDEFSALSGVPEQEAFGHLDDALAAGIIEPVSAGYRFRHCLIRDALTGDVPAHRRRQVHRDTARRLVELGASPARIGHHFLAAGAGADAVPHLLSAAETESAVGAYRDALALVDAIRPHAVGHCRTRALSLRADLLTAIGDPMAGPAYREALGGAGPADARRLRARLANSAVMAGDLATAAAALDGLDPDGGAERDMVEPGLTLVERVLAVQVGKAMQPEQGVAQLVHDVPERPGVLVQDRLNAEDAGVPGLADRQVGHRHGDVRDGGNSS